MIWGKGGEYYVLSPMRLCDFRLNMTKPFDRLRGVYLPDMNTHAQSDTIVALSTGQGIAAISMIRMSGSKSFEIADRVFKGVVLNEKPSHTLHYGRIENEAG